MNCDKSYVFTFIRCSLLRRKRKSLWKISTSTCAPPLTSFQIFATVSLRMGSNKGTATVRSEFAALNWRHKNKQVFLSGKRIFGETPSLCLIFELKPWEMASDIIYKHMKNKVTPHDVFRTPARAAHQCFGFFNI